MFPVAVSQGNSADSWNMSALRPVTSIDPVVGSSSPAIRLRRVVLPHPDAPTTQVNEPFSMSRLRTSSAATVPFPEPKTFVTASSRTAAAGVMARAAGARGEVTTLELKGLVAIAVSGAISASGAFRTLGRLGYISDELSRD